MTGNPSSRQPHSLTSNLPSTTTIPTVLFIDGDTMQTQSKIAHRDILSEFKRKLDQDWKRTNWVDQVFYVRDEIYGWMVAGNPTNAVRLLVTVNQRIRGGRFPEIQSSDLFKRGATCFIVFAILLSLDYGHLIHIFHKHSVNDYRLDWNIEEWKDAHQAIQADLEAEGLNASRVIAAFQARKWAFNPVPLTLMMHNHLKGVDWILPFAKCRKVAEGGTATVYQVLVQEELLADDFREAIAAGRQNHESLRGCYEFAIKEYTKAWEPDFKRECHAFMAIRGQEGMVQFLGQFVRDRIGDNGKRETTYNILLEYGEFDLEEFFGEQQQYPPVLQLEIVLFWESFFKVADAISRVHNLTIRTEDGQTKIYNGWHADIKPENILRVYGEFKLADFGFAKFADFKGSGHIPTSFIDGGTAAYGAPETDVKRLRRETLTPVTQTIDTWSFGCVLSITATWVILGVQGVYQYQQVRKAAIAKLNGQRPSSHDAFHDGQSVLPQVLDWHRLLRASMRKCDPITDKILDLIEERMLVASPLDRIQCKDLCKKLDSFIEDAHRACHRPEVSITQDVMTTLLEFDRRAPSTASEAEEIKAKQKSLEGTLDADALHERPAGSLAIPNEHGRLKSKRFPKPDRQVIIQGKFAHRTLALKSALAIMRESSNESPPSDIDRGKHPENSSASPFDAPPRIAGSPTPSSLYDSPHPPGSFDGPMNRLSADLDQLSIANSVTNPAWHGHQTDEWERGKASRPTTDMAPRHTPPPIVLTEEPHQMTPKASPAPNEYHTGTAVSAATEGPLHIQPPQGPSEPPPRTAASRTGTLTTHHPSAAAASLSRTTTPGTIPKAVPHMSPYRHLADCNEAICKERIRLDTAKRNAGFFRKPKKDEALKDLISARDFIFVVDRAPTMIPCWEWATFLVETLAMKLARIDDDGLDLVFTSGAGAEYNLTKEKSASAFKLAMQRAEPKVHAPKTDMSICLGEISRSYWSKVYRKKLTLIIVTDGMWGLLPSASSSGDGGGGGSSGGGGGSARENPVDNKITNFVKDLRATVGESKVEDRWFSIQFISFATDPLAHAYLKFLDSGFWKKHGIPDVIDTKPWHHPQVENLILGSLNIYADDDSDDEQGETTTTPAETGYASSQYKYSHHAPQYNGQAGPGPSTAPTTAHSSLSPTPRSLSRSPSRQQEAGLSRSRSKRKSWLSGGLLKKP